jgi:hypothetical protein
MRIYLRNEDMQEAIQLSLQDLLSSHIKRLSLCFHPGHYIRRFQVAACSMMRGSAIRRSAQQSAFGYRQKRTSKGLNLPTLL